MGGQKQKRVTSQLRSYHYQNEPWEGGGGGGARKVVEGRALLVLSFFLSSLFSLFSLFPLQKEA